jgi:hypothetical protein
MATGVNADPFGLMPTALEVIGQDGVQRIAAAANAQMALLTSSQ